MTSRSATLTTLAVLAALTLVGCAADRAPTGSLPSAEASPSATPTPSPENTGGGEEPVFAASCEDAVDPAAIYDFNPNFARDAGYAPAAGTVSARIVEAGGIACAWVNLTSGTHLVVALAEPGQPALDALESDLASGGATEEYSVPGYFSSVGGVGQAVVFVDSAVLAVSSEEFFVAADATQLVDAVVAEYAG